MRPREELQVDDIRFVGEQDGNPERLLKEKLVEIFQSRADIRGAYLARVVLEPAMQTSVALCLYSPKGGKQATLDLIQATFAGIFVEGEHLDMMFLRRDQLEKLNLVCEPFYVRATLFDRFFARRPSLRP